MLVISQDVGGRKRLLNSMSGLVRLQELPSCKHLTGCCRCSYINLCLRSFSLHSGYDVDCSLDDWGFIPSMGVQFIFLLHGQSLVPIQAPDIFHGLEAHYLSPSIVDQ